MLRSLPWLVLPVAWLATVASCGGAPRESYVVTPAEPFASPAITGSIGVELQLLTKEAKAGDMVEVVGSGWRDGRMVEIFLLTERQYKVDLERASRALEALREGEFVKLGNVQAQDGSFAFKFPLQTTFVRQVGNEIEVSAGDSLFLLGYQAGAEGSAFTATGDLLVVQ